MSAREMWAPKEWQGIHYMVSFSGRPEPVWSDDVRVLVEEIPEGRPSFKVGDEVGCGNWKGRVAGMPFRAVDNYAEWRVPVQQYGMGSADASAYYKCCDAKSLTLIPPETSRLIRVTGPEDAVRAYVADAAGTSRVSEDYGVRVEVVE